MPLYSDEKVAMKVKNMQASLRAKDEKILSLETENAMLYLKLAQSEGYTRDYRLQVFHLRRMLEEVEHYKEGIQAGLTGLLTLVKNFRTELNVVREEVTNLPLHWTSQTSVFRDETRGALDTVQALSWDQHESTMTLQNRLNEAELALDEAMRRANEERVRRQTLHNTLIELRGNIRVYCRVRPLLRELDAGSDSETLGLPNTSSEQIVDVVDEESLTFKQNQPGNGSRVKQYEFEKVFQPTHSQEAVFHDVAPLLTSLLDGYNVCIMAYGQTGSGKTHTMLGVHDIYDDPRSTALEDGLDDARSVGDVVDAKMADGLGVIPRAAAEIFRLIKERESKQESYSLEVCVFEVYNNDIIDLLATPEKRETKHNVFSASDGSQEVPSLTTRSISSSQDVMEYVVYGLRHRHEDRTKIHLHSSRSHLVVQLNLFRTTAARHTHLPKAESPTHPGGHVTTNVANRPYSQERSRSAIPRRAKSPSSPVATPSSPSRSKPVSRDQSPSPADGVSDDNHRRNVVVKTKLQLVDLAGSECVGMSGVTGTALRETSNINKSLSALADVLQALAEHQQHVPYRNTRLTHILQDTIGGDAKLLVMLCVSPALKYATETSQCLGFGSRARQVMRGPARKRKPTGVPGFPAHAQDINGCPSLPRPQSSSNLLRSSSLRRINTTTGLMSST